MSYLDEAIVRAGALGGAVAEAFKPAIGWRLRADALNAELEAVRAASEQSRADLVRGVAEGKLELAEVAKRAVNPWEFDSPASKVVVAAVAACHSQVDTATVQAAPKLFEALQTLAGEVVAESVTLTASLPANVTDERAAYTASKGGAKHFQSWVRLEELVDVWVRAHELAEVLRRASWVPGPAHRHKSALRPFTLGFTKFAYPWRLPGNWAGQPEPLKLGAAKAAGAEPGLYDWAEAEERLAVLDRRQGRSDVHAMNVTTVHKNAFEAGAYMEVAANTSVPRPALAVS